MIRTIKYHLERILFHEGLLFYSGIVFDRIAFHLFYKYAYQKRFGLYGTNVRWGRNSMKLLIPRNVTISCPERIYIGDNCQFGDYVSLRGRPDGENLVIGRGVRCNEFTYIHAYSSIDIGDYVLIAPFCHINTSSHGYDDTATPIMFQRNKKGGSVEIGAGSWLGRGVQVLGGAGIGKNSVVAAGAIVTRVFSDHSILAGIPAKIVKDIRQKDDV